METTTEPATQQQLLFLEQHGYSSQGPMTRTEAAGIIRKLREGPGAGIGEPPVEIHWNPNESYRLGLVFDLAANPQPGSETNPLLFKRRDFWMDTCREVTQMHSASSQICELYKLYGCRFSQPTVEEVQEVLDALDTAMPDWERNHPELFYSTLELNFPELLKRVV